MSIETPQQAARRLFSKQVEQGYIATALYEYTESNGQPIYFRARLDHAEKGKYIRPFYLNGNGYQTGEPEISPKPLYGLHRLSDNTDTVFIVEGEKAADALIQCGYIALTSGSASSAGKADWKPLKGRDVVIWPDNDEPGNKYAQDIIESLAGVSESVRVIEQSALNLPPKGDCVDWMQSFISWDGIKAISEHDKQQLQPMINALIQSSGEYKPDYPEIIPLPSRGDIESSMPYSLEELPLSIREAAKEIARFDMVPEASPAVIGLGVLATAISKKAVIEERPGHSHYPALFFALIAASGERKSPPFKKQSQPLEKWTAEKARGNEEKIIEAQANNAVINARQKALEGKAKKDGADLKGLQLEIAELETQKIQPPAHPSLFTTDTTEQRLFQKMDERGGAYAVMSGEGRPVIDAIMGKYSGDGKTGDAIYLAGISGDTITRDRVGSDKGPEERIINDPCLNVCIMIQPDKYLEAAGHPALRASGALARIWPVWLPSRVGTRFEDENDTGLNSSLLLPFQNLVQGILNHEPVKDDMGLIIPHKAKLSPEASKARRLFHNTIEKQMQEGDELEDVRDIASKTVSQTCKLALVLHIADNPDRLNTEQSEINLSTWATAQALGTFHLLEAIRVQRLASEDPLLEAARRISRWLSQAGLEEVTARHLQQYGPRPRPKGKDAESVLSLLSEHGYLIQHRDKNHRKWTYKVNPALSVAVVATVAGGKGE